MTARPYEKYEKFLTLACVNFQTSWGDKGTNLERMKSLVAQAAQAGNNMVVFPELALSGYECDGGCDMHARTAETIPGPATEEMAKVAADHGIYVVFGMPEQDSQEAKKRYISTAVVGPEGLVGAYRKLHLSEPPAFTESLCFTSGRQLPVFETRYGLIGIQICYDFWIFPELTKILVLKGAGLIINTTGSPSGPGKPFYLSTITCCRAAENRVFTASANLVGREVKRSYYGHSTIAGPAPPWPVRVYAQGGEEEEIVSATLNLEVGQWWRDQSNWMAARKADVILDELNQLRQPAPRD